jgi:Tfp pilus assembly protein FimT
VPVFRVPRGRDPRATVCRRPAFTLIETLLTLCILLILGAIAWPTLERTLAGHRLQKAADQLRAEWTVARVDALESGVPYRFLYLPGSNRFRIQRADDCDPNGNGTSQQGSGTQSGSNAPSGSGTQQDSQSTMGIASAEPQREGSLPEGVTFPEEQTAVAPDDPNNSSSSSQSGSTSSSNTPSAANAPPGASGSSSGDNAGWSDPLWFNPDGTTSTARLVLKNTYNFTVEISLRGFTGVATVGLVLAAGEKE